MHVLRTSSPLAAILSARWSGALAWKIASALVLLGSIPLAVHMALAPGMTLDELVQRIYGDQILAWYQSGFANRDALSYANLYLYGGLFELPVQWLLSTHVLPWGVYESRHVVTSLVALLGVVATWLSVQQIRGPRAAFFAAAMLLLTPAWVGHGLFNPKDIPFAVAVAFVMYASVRIAVREPPLTWPDAVCSALSVGCALGVRPGGMFLLAYPFAALGLRLTFDGLGGALRDTSRAVILRALFVSLGRLACVLPLAWLVMLSAWPWAQQAPFTRPFEAAAIAANFEWPLRIRFDGGIVSSSNLPWNYLPTWFLVTLPELYALALACGVVALASSARDKLRGRSLAMPRLDRAQATATVLLAMFVAAPIAGVWIARPKLYDAHRHFLFVIPSLAALAGLAFDQLLERRELPILVRGAFVGAAVALASVTLQDMIALHPYEYVYFNRTSGGLAKQATRFETDYWGASYREGFDWVFKNYDVHGTRKITVSTCGADKRFPYYRKQWGATRFVLAHNKEASEIYLGVTRGNCHVRPGEVIHTIDRQGVPLLYIRRRPPG